MLIWLSKIGEPLPIDSNQRLHRTGMLAEELANRGHNIVWWSSTFDHSYKRMLVDKDTELSVTDSLTLRLLRGCEYRKNVSFRRYIDHRIIARKFNHEARNMVRPDIVVASMPCHHLAYEVVRYATCNNVPVIVDIRDLWPDIFLGCLPNFLKSVAQLLLVQDYARLHYLLTQADSIIAVSNGYLDWARRKIDGNPRQSDRVFYLGHKTLDSHRQEKRNTNTITTSLKWLGRIGNKKAVIFIGTFGVSYELQLIVEVALKLNELGNDDVCFVLAGIGEQERVIKKQTIGVPNVIITGWLDREELGALLQAGWVGIVPCRSIKDTVPNKPFEYASASLPIISSLEGEFADLIEQHQIGLNYKVSDADGLFRCIKTLLERPDLYKEMSRNSKRFFREYGDAERIYTAYADHVERTARNRRLASVF